MVSYSLVIQNSTQTDFGKFLAVLFLYPTEDVIVLPMLLSALSPCKSESNIAVKPFFKDLLKQTQLGFPIGDRTRVHQASFNHLPAVLANQGGSRQPEVGQCDAHLQEGLEGGSGKLQVCQPYLVLGKVMKQINLLHHMAHVGLPAHQDQPAWV